MKSTASRLDSQKTVNSNIITVQMFETTCQFGIPNTYLVQRRDHYRISAKHQKSQDLRKATENSS